MDFLYSVYANAIADTALNLVNSSLPAAEKIHEFNKILLRQVTVKAYDGNSPEITSSRQRLLSGVLMCACELSEDNDEFRAIIEKYLPQCAAIVNVEGFRILRLEKELLKILIEDDRERLVEKLVNMAGEPKYSPYYGSISEMLRRLSREDPLLGGLDDTEFLRRYGNIYLMLYHGGDEYGAALDVMTDILLNGQPSSETLIIMYISLAAMLECVDEFIFGKIKLSLFYVNDGRFDECRTILDELTDMGVEDNDEMISIKAKLP